MQEFQAIGQDSKHRIQSLLNNFHDLPSNLQRLFISGILSTCSLSHLSHFHTNLPSILRTDIISKLPTELSLRILVFCDANALCRAAQVSHRWKQLADADVIWHRLCEQHIDRKCGKCGWGIPLILQKKPRKYSIDNSGISTCATSSLSNEQMDVCDTVSNDLIDEQVKVGKWKRIYAERFVVEKNWRSNRNVHEKLSGHVGDVLCLIVEGDDLISGSTDKTVCVWDLEKRTRKMELVGHTEGVLALACDESKIISGSADSTIKIWNRLNGTVIKTLICHRDAVTSLAMDESILVSGSSDCSIIVWKYRKNECHPLSGHQGAISQVLLDKKNRVYSSSMDGTVRIWNWLSKECLKTFSHSGSINCIQQICKPVDCSLPHKVLITGSSDCTVAFWDIDEEAEIQDRLCYSSRPVTSLSANQLRLAIGAQKGIYVNDIQTRKLLFKICMENTVKCVRMTDTLLINTDGRDISIWDYGFSFKQ